MITSDFIREWKCSQHADRQLLLTLTQRFHHKHVKLQHFLIHEFSRGSASAAETLTETISFSWSTADHCEHHGDDRQRDASACGTTLHQRRHRVCDSGSYALFQHDMNASRARLQHQSGLSFPGPLWRWQWTKNTFSPSERHICMLLHGDRSTAQSEGISKKSFFPAPYMKFILQQQQEKDSAAAAVSSHSPDASGEAQRSEQNVMMRPDTKQRQLIYDYIHYFQTD